MNGYVTVDQHPTASLLQLTAFKLDAPRICIMYIAKVIFLLCVSCSIEHTYSISQLFIVSFHKHSSDKPS